MEFDGAQWQEVSLAMTEGHKSMSGAAVPVAPVAGGAMPDAFTHDALTLTATAVFSGAVQSAGHASAGENIGVSVPNPGGLG